MSLIKAFVTIQVALFVELASRPPTPSVPKDQRKLREGPLHINVAISYVRVCREPFEVLQSLILGSCQYLQLTHAAIELLILGCVKLEMHWQSHLMEAITNFLLPYKNTACIRLSPISIFGATLAIFGAVGRLLCFKELGQHFTYDVAILKHHQLITSGPYSLVRHPSYISGTIMHAGVLTWFFAKGSWCRESGMLERPIAWLLIVPTICLYVFAPLISVRRVKYEDELLKKEFGEEWDKWSHRVPYRLIPWVY